MTPRLRRLRAIAIAATWGTFAMAIAPSQGEFLRFRRGGEVLLPARRDGELVRIQGPSREHAILRTDIKEFRADPTPENIWQTQRQPSAKATDSEILAAIRWALSQGLTDEAIATLAKVEPTAEPAELQRMRKALNQLRSTPTPPTQALSAIRQAIRGEFRIASSPHIVLLHQHDDRDAEERLRLLERVLTAFHLDAALRGLPGQPPHAKLIHVYFAKRSAYQAYLRRDRAEGFLTTRGFYHPERRAAFACDARDDADLRQALGSLQVMTGSEAERRRLLWDLEWRRRDHGSAAHEMIHQLIDQSGLEPKLGMFPSWLHEGWAAQFETVANGRWAGVDAIPSERLADWRGLEATPNLADLIARPWPKSRDAAYYARSWAFVRYLRRERPDAFADCIQRLRAGAPASRILDAATLEPEWRAFMQSISRIDP